MHETLRSRDRDETFEKTGRDETRRDRDICRHRSRRDETFVPKSRDRDETETFEDTCRDETLTRPRHFVTSNETKRVLPNRSSKDMNTFNERPFEPKSTTISLKPWTDSKSPVLLYSIYRLPSTQSTTPSYSIASLPGLVYVTVLSVGFSHIFPTGPSLFPV